MLPAQPLASLSGAELLLASSLEAGLGSPQKLVFLYHAPFFGRQAK